MLDVTADVSINAAGTESLTCPGFAETPTLHFRAAVHTGRHSSAAHASKEVSTLCLVYDEIVSIYNRINFGNEGKQNRKVPLFQPSRCAPMH